MTNFKNALAENREFIQSLNDKEFWGVVQKEAPTDMGRYVAPAKRGNLQEMIYLGATFLLATNALPRNIAIALGNALAGLAPLAFVAYMNRFQIRPEERALREKFGAAFDAYAQATRRWL